MNSFVHYGLFLLFVLRLSNPCDGCDGCDVIWTIFEGFYRLSNFQSSLEGIYSISLNAKYFRAATCGLMLVCWAAVPNFICEMTIFLIFCSRATCPSRSLSLIARTFFFEAQIFIFTVFWWFYLPNVRYCLCWWPVFKGRIFCSSFSLSMLLSCGFFVFVIILLIRTLRFVL
jgi:hypothetical protein